MSTHRTPSATDGVLAITASATINASRDEVWKVLVDFSSYPDWNSFVRFQAVVDQNERPLQDQTIRLGSRLSLKAHLPPSMKPRSFPATTKLIVSHLDPENYTAVWTNRMPAWLMTTERWQWLTVVEGDSGLQTRYETIEVFSGFFAYFVKWFVSANLRLGFQAMADDLKDRVEGGRE